MGRGARETAGPFPFDGSNGPNVLTESGVVPSLPRLLFQVVPEPKVVKNRVDLDVHVDDGAALVERLLALGATKLWDGRQGPMTWVTLADPEGNELCVA